MALNVRRSDVLTSVSRSTVLAAIVLGAGAGAIGFPVTASDLFHELPALFLIGIVVAVGLALFVRGSRGRSAVPILAGLLWVLTASALLIACVKLDAHVAQTLAAVTSEVAPSDARLASAGSLALISGVVAAASIVVARLAGSRHKA